MTELENGVEKELGLESMDVNVSSMLLQ